MEKILVDGSDTGLGTTMVGFFFDHVSFCYYQFAHRTMYSCVFPFMSMCLTATFMNDNTNANVPIAC